MFSEIPAELILEVYMTGDFYNRYETNRKSSYHVEIVSDDVFSKMSDTVTPQGVIAVVKMQQYTLKDVMSGGFVLLLENIQDPGNLGTLFRTAEGAGVTGVIMSKGTADIYNTKVTRSTMGSIFRMPYYYIEDIKMAISQMQKADYTIYAAALEGAVDYTTASYVDNIGILIGNEGNGLNKDTIEAAGNSVFIPMQGQVESLNASISGAVLMYEAARQRRQ